MDDQLKPGDDCPECGSPIEVQCECCGGLVCTKCDWTDD